MKKLIRHVFEWRLFSRPHPLANTCGIIKWWELRRIAYNAIVGAAGLFVIILVGLGASLCEARGGRPIGISDPPIFMVLWIFIYGVLANVCYTAGWIGELIAKTHGLDHNLAGRILFFWGILFSIVLTLIPGLCLIPFQILELLSPSTTSGN